MGKRIYMKRTENGMTMKQLADKLGVQTSAINKYEKGAVENIKRKTIEDMAKIFKCSPSWLMGFDADMDITLTLPIPKGRGFLVAAESVSADQFISDRMKMSPYIPIAEARGFTATFGKKRVLERLCNSIIFTIIYSVINSLSAIKMNESAIKDYSFYT